jgi:hypothetical protein
MMRLPLLFLLLCSLCITCKTTTQQPASSPLAVSGEAALTPIRKIAALLKNSVKDKDPEEIKAMMRGFYLQMRLIDDKGVWQGEELGKAGDYLLAHDLSQTQINAFIDEAAAAAEANPYLVTFMERASSEEFEKLSSAMAREGDKIFPELVAYALMLERVTVSMRNNWLILKECYGLFKAATKAAKIREEMGWFDVAKLVSVEYPVMRTIEYNTKGAVSPDFLKTMLPLNISEAVVADIQKGNHKNAHVGAVLTVNRPGSGCNDENGHCPARWSHDKKAILVSMPSPQKWADLYQVWNLAFTTELTSFPFVHAKLVIPQVAKYQNSPEEYIYNRMLALYVHLNYIYLRRSDFAFTDKDYDYYWNDKGLTRLFGEVNFESSKEYESTLVRRDPAWKQVLDRVKAKFIR